MLNALTNAQMLQLLQCSVGWLSVKELSIEVVFVVEAMEYEQINASRAVFYGHQYFMQLNKDDEIEWILMEDKLIEVIAPTICLRIDLETDFKAPRNRSKLK